MRAAILGVVATTVLGGQAMAADYLRGSTYEPPPAYSPFRWSGWYFGGQIGYTESNARFGRTGRPASDPLRPTIESASQLATWVELPGASARGLSYGGFVGYNAQWGDTVLGLEANYSHFGRRATSAGLELAQGGGLVNYDGSARVTDVMTFRARAGYAWSYVMPYAFVGLAVGRVDTTRIGAISFPPPGPPPIPTYTDVDARNGNYTVGFATGAGVDVGLTQNLFLRAEYEFVQLSTINGVRTHMNTVRTGAALKF